MTFTEAQAELIRHRNLALVKHGNSLLARGMSVDDGFTWFEAVSTEALGLNNIPYSTGWVLKSHLRIFGDYPNRSA